MTLEDLLSICSDFDGLGWAVRDQLLEQVMEGDLSSANPNALKLIQKFLTKVAKVADGSASEEAREHAKSIDEYLKSLA